MNARTAQRITRTAVFTAGALTGVTLVSAGLLASQAEAARRTIPLAEGPPPRADGVFGAKFGGHPLVLAVLGDSTAAGYGVLRTRETPGALLATGLSRRLRRPVRLHRFAVVGAITDGLRHQLQDALEVRPDLAVILIGANDVTKRTPVTVAARQLADAVRGLRGVGAEVVVGTCPDLGTIRPIKPPLRWLARRWSRQLAEAQTIAVVEAGGRTVSLGDLLGPRFFAEPTRMFAWDHFHPSADGYAVAAAAMLPTAVAALGVPSGQASTLSLDQGVRSLSDAAQEAVKHAGTEVSAERVAGRERGPLGRWVRLRRLAVMPRQQTPDRDTAAVPLGKALSGKGDMTPPESTDGRGPDGMM
ncbi:MULTISPECIES: SGNH/GDSL hydrolase family protein [Catenuloplanes]|uniref:Lysophospholipase L1-like esterase n=1 Tax=Catenuloplanes niger TaxID=587534 RepID=A0AAE4CTV5_9ACTN|nr:SGNH/GDSL hydrolase family protein [Catenuloplanes niger]MDR7322708.1 lysophospholipase L1-like esterase [Catenuloplanes niger]